MFKKSENPFVSLGIGQKARITKWLDEMEVNNYTINDDYTINVSNGVNLSMHNLIKFPDYIQFNKIRGSFWCYNNKLISLRGCPSYVDGNFSCENNNLTTLEGCP
jgi:hypothetical protein